MAIRGHGVTHQGRVRKHNEDALLVSDELGLFVLADGMGGQNAGEVAARVTIESIEAFITRSAKDRDHTWPFGVETQLSYQANRVRTAVKLANRTVLRESEGRAQYTGMGTTVVVVLVEGATATICSVGDSRAYAIADGAIERLTRDHTWVEALRAQNPEMDAAVLARHPMRHVLTSVVGVQPDVDTEIVERQLAAGERLLLCTDGVHRGVSDERLRAIVSGAPDAEAAAERVVAEALDVDGSDNITAVVVGQQ